MATLNEKQAALFTDRNWGVIATIGEDGSPHATPVWIDYALLGPSRTRYIAHDKR